MRPLAVVCLSLAALGSEPAPRPRVLGLPLVTVGPGVPGGAAARVGAILAEQLQGSRALELLAPPSVDGGAPGAALGSARQAVQQAQALRERHDLAGADEALGRALAAFEAAAAVLPDPDELGDALALRAAVRRGLGQDPEAAADLAAAVALAPDRELPLARTSRGLARAAAEAAAAVKALPGGTLRVESSPPGAAVRLDGRALGGAPVEVQGVPPGTHLWQARLPQGVAVGGLVAVSSTRPARVRAEAAPTGPQERLLLALAGGRLDAAGLADAAALARGAGTPWLLVGALARSGEGLTLEALLVAPATGEVRRLPLARFDGELLSAATALAVVTGELAGRGPGAGVPATLPVALAAPGPAALTATRWRAGAPVAEEALVPEPTTAPRRRVPLSPP